MAAAATCVPVGRGGSEQRASGAAYMTQQSFSTDSGELLNAASLMITSTGTTRLISHGCTLAPLTAEQHSLPVNTHWQLPQGCVWGRCVELEVEVGYGSWGWGHHQLQVVHKIHTEADVSCFTSMMAALAAVPQLRSRNAELCSCKPGLARITSCLHTSGAQLSK